MEVEPQRPGSGGSGGGGGGGGAGDDDHDVLVSLGGSSGRLLEDKSHEEDKGMCPAAAAGGSEAEAPGGGGEHPHPKKRIKIFGLPGHAPAGHGQGQEEAEWEEGEEGRGGDPSTGHLMQLATVLLNQHLQSPAASTTPDQAPSPPRSPIITTRAATTTTTLAPPPLPHDAEEEEEEEEEEEDPDGTGIGSRGLEVVARLLRLGRPAAASTSDPPIARPPPPPPPGEACAADLSSSITRSFPPGGGGPLQLDMLAEGAGFLVVPPSGAGVATEAKPTPMLAVPKPGPLGHHHRLPQDQREEEEEEEVDLEEDSDDEMEEDDDDEEEEEEMDELVVAKMPPSITDHTHHRSHHSRNHPPKAKKKKAKSKMTKPLPPPPPMVAWTDCASFHCGTAGALLPQRGTFPQQLDVKTMRHMVMALRHEDAKQPSPRMSPLVTAFKASPTLRLPMLQALTEACHDRMVDLRAVTIDMLTFETDLQAAMTRDHGVGLAELLSSLVTCVRDEMRLHFPEDEEMGLGDGSDDEMYGDEEGRRAGVEEEEELGLARKEVLGLHLALPSLSTFQKQQKPPCLPTPPQPLWQEVDQGAQTTLPQPPPQQQPCPSPSASSSCSSIICTDSDDEEATRAPPRDLRRVSKWAEHMRLIKEALVCLGVFLRSHSRKMASNALDRAEMELISDAVVEIIAAYPLASLRILDLVLRAWPYGQSTREVGFLQLLGIVFTSAPVLPHLDGTTRLHLRAFARLANCLQSPHVAVAEEAVLVCSKPRVIALYVSEGAPGGGGEAKEGRTRYMR